MIKIVEKPWFLSGAVCLLLLLTAAAFLPCLTNGFTNWDDPDYLTNNPLVLSLSFQNLKEIFFSDYCPNRYLSPLVVFTFAVEHHFFGKSPLSYHTTNLALHLLNTLLTFWLIRRVSKNPWVGFLTALLFAVHPLRVESVAWITERKDVLCSFFFLTALLTYLNYQKTNRRSFYLASLLLFLLSLAVKPLAITFPLLLICFDFLGTKRPGKKTLYQKIPFFALSFLYGFLILRTQSRFFSETPVSALTPARHFFYGAYAILFYLAKLLVPVKLSCVYPIPKKTANLPLLYMAAPSLLLLLTAGLVALKKYSRIILFGSLFFFLTVLPAIQIIPVNASIVFDRYTYLPSIGFFYVIAEGICAILRSQRSRLLKQAVVLCVVIGVAGAVILTRQRCAIWDNDLALWTDAVSKYPNIALARLNRGNALCIRGKVSEAITDYDAAISLSRKYADAYCGRGNAYMKIGDYAKAISDLNIAIKLKPSSPQAADNLWKAYLLFDETVARELAENPSDAGLHYNRGLLLEREGRNDQAILSYSKAIELNGRFAEAFNNRGNLYYEKGLYRPALNDYRTSLRINPKQQETLFNRRLVLKKLR